MRPVSRTIETAFSHDAAKRQPKAGRLWAGRWPTINPIRETSMKQILLWLIGVPIPIILLLWFFNII